MKALWWKVNGAGKALNYDLLHVDSTKYSYPWARYFHKEARRARAQSNSFMLYKYM
jgi:hypothetical protein